MRFMVYGIPASFLVLGAGILGDASAPRLLVYLGNSSYLIYLTHVFFALGYHNGAEVLPHAPPASCRLRDRTGCDGHNCPRLTYVLHGEAAPDQAFVLQDSAHQARNCPANRQLTQATPN
jgi:hypothetical protein